jgi:hypothetical protein
MRIFVGMIDTNELASLKRDFVGDFECDKLDVTGQGFNLDDLC